VEVYLLLALARATSWWAALAMVVVPGILGAWLVKHEGLKALGGVREALSLAREPTGAILDAVLVLLAGAFLITPGVLTDLTGLALLLPPVRRKVAAYSRTRIRRAIDRHLAEGAIRVPGFEHAGHEVIDAEEIRPRAR
jgi:UPF0716 protein FxsA